MRTIVTGRINDILPSFDQVREGRNEEGQGKKIKAVRSHHAQMHRKLRELGSAFFHNNSSHDFLKNQSNTQPTELQLRNKWYKFDEEHICLVEVPHSGSF